MRVTDSAVTNVESELPTEVPRKRHGVGLLGSAANLQNCMHVGLGQPAEPPTQTTERGGESPGDPAEHGEICLLST